MASLREIESYNVAIWQSRKTPVGGRLALQLLKFLGLLAILGVLYGLALLQPRYAPAPPARNESDSTEVSFTFVPEPGSESPPPA